MNILLIGETHHLEEFQAKFGKDHEYTLVHEHREAETFLRGRDLVFDFIIDEEPEQFEIYVNHTTTVFINTAKISLHELAHMAGHSFQSKILGFNGLPTLLNRDVLEVSLLMPHDEEDVKTICEKLNTAYLVVDDRVGLVTPRIVCMIINEAYYTVQDGTATRDDIDMAMKLGTNYPYGPFEWCQRIGVKHVFEVLEAVYDDTKDERYKICPLLKKEYLRLGISA